jgi:hypothetical protein
MPNRSIDDNWEALHDLNLGTTRTGLSDLKSHHVPDHARPRPMTSKSSS